MTHDEKVSIGITLLGVAAAILGAWYGTHFTSVLWLAVSVGALGGLTHEAAQSRGMFAFPKMQQDGLYLGSLSGMVLGLVAGLLVVRGDLATQGNGLGPGVNMVQLNYEIFMAGLALKGVAEAATGHAVTPPQAPSDSTTDASNKKP